MRQIHFSPEFDKAVLSLGGYRAIDPVFQPVLEGLLRNPWGFPKFENDFTTFRYVSTKRFADLPALWFQFRILENNDVELLHVESFDEN